MVDPDATATAPGAVSRVKEEAAGHEASTAHANAVILGKLFAERSGNCASKGNETQVLVDNAPGYADRYALGAGIRRRTSRIGAPNSRAGWFVRDGPKSMGNAEWRLYDAAGEFHLPDFLCVAPYRMAEGMPRPDALRGSLCGEGYVYQFAARFSSLVFLPVAVWLTPAVSYDNRVMATEVIARGTVARRRMMGAGSSAKLEVEKYEGGGAPWTFNSALDSVAGATLFGIAVNQTRDNAGMPQVRFAGAAPNAGESHYAFPSDCLPWPTRNGNFVIDAEVSPEDRDETRGKLAADWKGLDSAYASGDRVGHAGWVPGCPVRAACGGVGGNRLLLLTPEPVAWEFWSAVTANLRNVNLASFERVDGLGDPLESLSHCAKQKSVGG